MKHNLHSLTQALTKLSDSVIHAIPEAARNTALLRGFGFFKIPMLYYLSPVVEQLNDKQCVVRIPLNRHSKNHLNSMYFGALSAGADCCIGLLAFHAMDKLGIRKKMNFIFKDFKAQFLHRAEDDTHFICTEGENIFQLVQQAMQTGERTELTVPAIATVPTKLGSEPVARFELTLSIKQKN